MKKSYIKIRALLVPAMIAIFLLTGSPNLQAQQPAPVEIKIDNFSFTPATLTVPLGTTITWTNHDDIPHTVVSPDSVFKSKALDTDEKFSYLFSKEGTYPYFCSIHPKMAGKIIVQGHFKASASGRPVVPPNAPRLP